MLACSLLTACFSVVGPPVVPDLPPLQTPAAVTGADDSPAEPKAPTAQLQAEPDAQAVEGPSPEAPAQQAGADIEDAAGPNTVAQPVASPTVDASPFEPASAVMPMDSEPPQSDRYVEVRPPRYRGTGLFATAGALFGVNLGLQAFDHVACGGGCLLGISERVLLAGTMATATAGGAMRGRADAYDGAAIRVRPRNVRGQMIAGGVLVGVGAVAGIANDAVFWRCGGPGFNDCAPGRTRLVMDASVLMVSVGGALLAHSLRYRRDSRFYERTRSLSVAPVVGEAMTGVTVGGRF